MSNTVAILHREAGEGDHAKRGGRGGRRPDFGAFAASPRSAEVGARAASPTAFGGPAPPLRGGGYGPFLRDLALYGLGSAAALGVDWSALTLLVHRGLPPLAAAATGFSLGMAVTYLASVMLVYADRRRGSRLREAASFVLVGLAGLGLNELLIFGFCAGLGLSAPLAKAPTAAFVFLFNFALRRALVFTAPVR